MFLNRLLAETYRLNQNTSIKKMHRPNDFVSDLFGFRGATEWSLIVYKGIAAVAIRCDYLSETLFS